LSIPFILSFPHHSSYSSILRPNVLTLLIQLAAADAVSFFSSDSASDSVYAIAVGGWWRGKDVMHILNFYRS
jgi:hypothetical protein